MNSVERTGFATLIGRLNSLGRGAVRAVRSSVRKGQSIVQAGIEANAMRAPRARVVNGNQIQPGGLGGSIGSSMGRTRSDGSFEAKTGLAVGKGPAPIDEQVRKGSKRGVSYGHFGILGTQLRWTGAKTRKLKSGKIKVKSTSNPVRFRGRVDPHPFVVQGSAAVRSTADSAMLTELERQIAKQWDGTT